MPKQPVTIHDVTEADALDVALFKWRIGVCSNGADKDVLDLIKQRGKITPEHAKRAAVLFRDVIEETDDWWVLYVACKCGAIENNTKALQTFDAAIGEGWGTGRLKEAIANARRNGHGHGAQRATLAEQCADYSRIWEGIADKYAKGGPSDVIEAEAFRICADTLKKNPAVASVLARRAKAEAK